MAPIRIPLILTFCFALGCAHGESVPQGTPLGAPEAPPSLSALPGVVPGSAADTPRVHEGLALTQRTLDGGLPTPPADLRFSVLQAWIEHDVVAWLGVRQKALRELEYRFSEEKGACPSERAVGRAAMGLIQEDTASELQKIPLPQELRQEPEIADIYVSIVEKQARPVLNGALVAYRDCSDIAYSGPGSMQHFARYCDKRFRRLRDRDKPTPDPQNGVTTVEVIAPQ